MRRAKWGGSYYLSCENWTVEKKSHAVRSSDLILIVLISDKLDRYLKSLDSTMATGKGGPRFWFWEDPANLGAIVDMVRFQNFNLVGPLNPCTCPVVKSSPVTAERCLDYTAWYILQTSFLDYTFETVAR